MAAFNINVNTEELKVKSNALKAVADSLEQDITSVINNVTNVSTGWTGTNSDAYVAAFNEFKPKMDANVAAIRATSDALDNTIVVIEQAQEEIKTGANALPQ